MTIKYRKGGKGTEKCLFEREGLVGGILCLLNIIISVSYVILLYFFQIRNSHSQQLNNLLHLSPDGFRATCISFSACARGGRDARGGRG